MRARRALLVLAFLLAPPPAGAEVFSLAIDAERSRVRFTLAATLHTVTGEGRVQAGHLRFQVEGGLARGTIGVDARSFRTGNETRDANMHEQVLESGRFPEILFTAEQLEVTARTASTADVVLHGRLTLHGADHPVAVPGHVAREDGGLRITGAFTVPYVAWGLRDVSTFVLRVAKEVEVQLDLFGALQLDAR